MANQEPGGGEGEGVVPSLGVEPELGREKIARWWDATSVARRFEMALLCAGILLVIVGIAVSKLVWQGWQLLALLLMGTITARRK